MTLFVVGGSRHDVVDFKVSIIGEVDQGAKTVAVLNLSGSKARYFENLGSLGFDVCSSVEDGSFWSWEDRTRLRWCDKGETKP